MARKTGVLERHEAAIVDLCQTPGASDKQVEDCVVNFLKTGYDDDDGDGSTKTKATSDKNNDDESDDSDDNDDEVDDSDDMIDSMLNMWADDLPLPTTTSGITDAMEDSKPKAKPWSSRSSPSGTFVRDPVTGEMRNIDA